MQFHSNVSNSTRLLAHWVRKKGIMPLELAEGIHYTVVKAILRR